MTIAGAVTPYTAFFLLQWVATPDESVLVTRLSPTPVTDLATVEAGVGFFVDNIPGVAAGDVLEWRLTGQTSSSQIDIQVTAQDPNYTYGEVDYLATAPRYTTVEKVKERLGIKTAAFDDRVLQAILASELAMDIRLARSLPDGGENPAIDGIPPTVVEGATSISAQVYRAGDSPTGAAGSESWFGAVDVSDAVRREFQRNPNLVGLAIGFGVA